MKSPFPGMDPYIEACGLWGDFHTHLIERIYERLAETVPDRYVVRTGERSYVVLVESEGKQSHPFVPDVSVTESRSRKKSAKKGGTALVEPEDAVESVSMRAFVQEEHRESFVEIYEMSPEQRLITTIEVFSPSNKHLGKEGWELYQRKRQSLLLGDFNLVEIDLLRSGKRMPMLDPWPEGPYSLLVAQCQKSPALSRLAGILPKAPALFARAAGETRFGHHPGPSADDRRHLPAPPLRAKHRLQQAVDPFSWRTRTRLA